jgi:predicted transcriptional regulator
MASALRDGITKSGKSANEIARATGVPQPTITRFLAGADMRLSRAQKIADYLGLELRPKK